MVFFAEGHLALGGVKAHAFHGGNELVGVGVARRLFERSDHGHRSRKTPGGEEVRRCLELLVMLGHHRLVHGVFRDAEVVIQRAFHAGEALVGHHGGQDVAPRRELDAVALFQIKVCNFGEWRWCARPAHRQVLVAGLVFELVDDALQARREISGAHGQVFLVHDLGFFGERLGRFDTITAKRVVVGQHRNHVARLIQRGGVGGSVLAGVAAGAKDVFVPLVAGDAVGHRRLYQQNLFVLFRHGQHGQCHGRRCWAHGDVHFFIGVSSRQGSLAHVGLALVVFFNHDQLAASHRHRAFCRVLQPHVKTHDGLLGIRLQRASLAGDDGDLDVFALGLDKGRGERGGCQRGHGDQMATVHGGLL